MSNWVRGYEDNYDAEEFNSFEELSATFAAFAESEHLGDINVPCWITFDSWEEEEPSGGTLSIGVFGTRKGRTWQWVSPATPEQVQEIRQRMMRIWAGRAEAGFERHMFAMREIAR